jgi:acyl-coenzyme A thioesterase PaaI-like protein
MQLKNKFGINSPMTIKEKIIATLGLWKFGITKIPLIFFIRPRIIEMNSKKCVVKIPFKRRTKNHLKSMYFGALSIGADLAGGLIAMNAIKKSNVKVNLIFKDMKVDFLKRVEGDAYFTCTDGELIKELVQTAIDTKERVSMPLSITTTVPDKFNDEPVAEFVLTISLKA